MTFWQENYHFIKDVYDMRHQKMLEWMENVEKAIARIMADKVYTSAEFKRERDNFHVSTMMHTRSCYVMTMSLTSLSGIVQGPLPRGGEEMAAADVRDPHG